MPVKKSTNQNSSASKKGKKISKEQKENIKLAVDSLPGMVISSQKEPEALPRLHTSKPLSSRYQNRALEEKKRKIVWMCVSLLMIIISCVWVYALRVQVKNSGFGMGSDSVLWETAKFDYNRILKPLKEDSPATSTSTQPVTYEESERIKEILAQNLIQLEQTTTSTSSTNEMVTSTPAQIVSTTEKIVTTTKK